MKAPDPVPAPWPEVRAELTDLQYVVYVCHLSVEAAAHHTGMTVGKVRAELAKSGPPPGFTVSETLR